MNSASGPDSHDGACNRVSRANRYSGPGREVKHEHACSLSAKPLNGLKLAGFLPPGPDDSPPTPGKRTETHSEETRRR